MKGVRVAVIGGMLALAWSALSPEAAAQAPEEIFGRGNAAYERGDYEEAIREYETVVQYRIRDARVEYNLGNAHFKLGNLGRSILHYERARRLDPTDGEIRANLELAKSRRFDKVEEPDSAWVVRSVRRLQDTVGPDAQAWAVLILVWLIVGLATLGWSRRAGWSAAIGWSVAALLVVAALAGASWYATEGRLEGRPLAVVLDGTVEVLAGPGENNASLFTVHEGLTMEIRSERRDWVQVSLPNGLHGWVPRSAVGLV
jgi:hypothetical protein